MVIFALSIVIYYDSKTQTIQGQASFHLVDAYRHRNQAFGRHFPTGLRFQP